MMTPEVDLRRLRSFVRIAELRSFSRAAIVMSIAQSALSRHIRELEDQFGEALFHRTGHGVTPTSFGLEILPRAKALLLAAEQFAQDMQAYRSVPTGDVSVAVLASLGPMLLTPFLDRVRRQFAGIQIRILEGLTHHIDEWLTTGRVDIGILYETTRFHPPTSEPLFKPELYLVGRRGDLPTERGIVSLAVAATLPLILPGLPNHHRATIERACAARKVQPRICFEMDSVPSTMELVAHGQIYTILPLHAVLPRIRSGSLDAARIMDPPIARQLVLATPSMRPASRATTEVIRLLRDESRTLATTLGDYFRP